MSAWARKTVSIEVFMNLDRQDHRDYYEQLRRLVSLPIPLISGIQPRDLDVSVSVDELY